MAIRSGAFIHDANGFVIDRIQTGGVSNVNQNTEVIRELGNWLNLQTVRDTVDLSFDLESLDVSTEIEAILTGADPLTIIAGQEFDLNDAKPIDIISPFKSATNQYDIDAGVIVPYLTLESATYRFGVRANATQSYTLRGDTINFTNETPRYEEFAITAGTNQVYTLAQTALPYVESGDTLYVLSACAKEVGTNNFKRLFIGSDYTNIATAITTLADLDALGYDRLHVTYATAAATSYTQTGNNPSGHAVHQGVAVKPAAIRGRDIDLYMGTDAATPVFTRWAGVQSVEINRRLSLEADEELGNYKYTAYEATDIPDVNGSIVLRPADVDQMMARIYEVLSITGTDVAGPYTSTLLPMEIRIANPDNNGAIIKTFYVPDARFAAPAIQGRVGQKLEITLNWSSDSGVVLIYEGER